ncbi:hypothetical protein MD484_g3329, partial [Candolleomyces efflorescens]
MSRAVRFEDTIPPTPDELATPHHADKGFNPKGILKGLKNGRATTSRRDRRYSTPVEELAKMQNLSRSISGGLSDNRQHLHHQYDYGVAYSSSSRRESPAGHYSRPLLSPRSQTFGTSSRHPYNPYATPSSSRHGGRWQEGDYGGSQVPGYGHSHATTHSSTGYPAGPVPSTNLLHPAFMYGASTATHSSPAYLTPESLPNTNLPPTAGDTAPRHHHQSSSSSVQDVVIQRSLKHPRIAWNIAFPFSSAVIDSHSKLRLSELDALATTPAIDKLTIKFDSYSRAQQALRLIFRAIKVRGSLPYEYNGTTIFLVTIRDVVNTIFDFFQTPLTRAEYANLTNDEAQTVLRAQRKRVGKNAYGFGDPLRVDLLGEHLRFEGIRITSFRERSITFGLDLSRW